jgi:rubrerythrin
VARKEDILGCREERHNCIDIREDVMGLMFDPNEIFQIAVRIEENGEKFYRAMSVKLDDRDVASLFSFLADEEVGHRRFYEGLLAGTEPHEVEESYPGEYFEQMRAYAEGVIFNQKSFERRLAEISDVAAALDFAIGVEWDSIHYYQEMKGLVPENKRSSSS